MPNVVFRKLNSRRGSNLSSALIRIWGANDIVFWAEGGYMWDRVYIHYSVHVHGDATLWLIDVFLTAFAEQWCSVAQSKKTY